MSECRNNLTVYALGLVKARAPGCFLCSRILEAMDASTRTLRAWPTNGDQIEFPVESQKAHVQLEAGAA